MTKTRKVETMTNAEIIKFLLEPHTLPDEAFENDRSAFKCECHKDPCECEEEAGELP